MRATLWILHDSTTQLAFADVDVPRDGIGRPPEFYGLDISTTLIGAPYLKFSVHQTAVFRLFNMIGWEPAVHAHYLLQNRPEDGWMWIVHPTQRPRLILARSLHPA